MSEICFGVSASPLEGMRLSGSFEVMRWKSRLARLLPGLAAMSRVVRVLIENSPLASCPEWQREHLFFNSGWMSCLKSTALTARVVQKITREHPIRMEGRLPTATILSVIYHRYNSNRACCKQFMRCLLRVNRLLFEMLAPVWETKKQELRLVILARPAIWIGWWIRPSRLTVRQTSVVVVDITEPERVDGCSARGDAVESHRSRRLPWQWLWAGK